MGKGSREVKELLEKTRRLNILLQGTGGQPVAYEDMAQVLSDLMEGNVYIIDQRGGILGYALLEEFECPVMLEEVLQAGFFPERYANWLLRVQESSPNISQEGLTCVFKEGHECPLPSKVTTIVPILGGGERLGTLILARYSRPFEEGELILSEYGATVVGMELLRKRSEEREKEAREKKAVEIAINSLSYSELEAILEIFRELNDQHQRGESDGRSGMLVASRIADKVQITRSVIVNALRKFEGAGVLKARSLGMKGTHIEVLNDHLTRELQKLDDRASQS
ncbi:MAG TPA: GTP-sensing pleiotropic transcriptional regulator CodY [Firmicutes bacterium]|jgi:transcriptional pleiotropic repressor|nr:GTP-sensing pleiotropic transcriptional regulator CodY [Bacillota bacterium]